MLSRLLCALLVASGLFLAFPAFAGGEEPVTRPHLDRTTGAQSVSLRGRTFINQGLVGTGRLSADTVDFLGDTLGSFSSLQIAPGTWKRVDDHFEAVLWTLPDRGRNDPDAKLFFDYAARLERLRLRFAPDDGRLDIIPDGGIELRDFRGKPFTGADPGDHTITQKGIVLPAPASGVGRGKVSIDAESLQFAHDGSFYIGDEYTANIYYFDARGHLQGVIQTPAAVAPRKGNHPSFGSLTKPDTGRRNNQGPEGVSLSPDGRTLFVVLQSALVQDSTTGDAAGRVNTRVLVYDVSATPTPERPVGHYVITLPAYNDKGDGGAPNRTAAQSEIHAFDDHSFLMLARDGAGLGATGAAPIVYKTILLVDTDGATNLAGSKYENGTASLLENPASTALPPHIIPASWTEFINMANPLQLSRFGLSVETLSEKWEAMDLVSALDPEHPADHFLFVGNDNDFIARQCRMSGEACNSDLDNDNRILVYRVTMPSALP